MGVASSAEKELEQDRRELQQFLKEQAHQHADPRGQQQDQTQVLQYPVQQSRREQPFPPFSDVRDERRKQMEEQALQHQLINVQYQNNQNIYSENQHPSEIQQANSVSAAGLAINQNQNQLPSYPLPQYAIPQPKSSYASADFSSTFAPSQLSRAQEAYTRYYETPVIRGPASMGTLPQQQQQVDIAADELWPITEWYLKTYGISRQEWADRKASFDRVFPMAFFAFISSGFISAAYEAIFYVRVGPIAANFTARVTTATVISMFVQEQMRLYRKKDDLWNWATGGFFGGSLICLGPWSGLKTPLARLSGVIFSTMTFSSIYLISQSGKRNYERIYGTAPLPSWSPIQPKLSEGYVDPETGKTKTHYPLPSERYNDLVMMKQVYTSLEQEELAERRRDELEGRNIDELKYPPLTPKQKKSKLQS